METSSLACKPHRVTIAPDPSSPPTSSSRRTKLEKSLMALTAILAIVIIAGPSPVVADPILFPEDGGSLFVTNSTLNWTECTSSACIEASARLKKDMDETADPCEDFYQFVCGGFHDHIRFAEGEGEVTQYTEMGKESHLEMRDLIERQDYLNESFVFKMVRNKYRTCMDLESRNRDSKSESLRILENFGVGGWPVLMGDLWDEQEFNWPDLVASFHKFGFTADLLVDFSVVSDVDGGSLFMGAAPHQFDESHLKKGLSDNVVSAWQKHMIKMAVYFGANPTRATEEMSEAVDMEIRLAQYDKSGDLLENYLTTTLGEVNQKVNISGVVDQWDEYLNNILQDEFLKLNASEPVTIVDVAYFVNLAEVLKTTSKRTVANYLYMRTAFTVFGYLDNRSMEMQNEFYLDAVNSTRPEAIWEDCMNGVLGTFEQPMALLYVRHHKVWEKKEHVAEIFHYMREQFRRNLEEVSWMDNVTQSHALHKLAMMREHLAYPEELMNITKLEMYYEGLHIENLSHLEQSMVIGKWNNGRAFRRLRESFDEFMWTKNAKIKDINAYYDPQENSVIIVPGILQGFVYNKDLPYYLNFATLGQIFGHEITHGFDSNGWKYNAEGRKVDWWANDTREVFLNRTSCIEEQYSNFEIEGVNATLDGKAMSGEVIADNGGLKESYRAYKYYISENGPEVPLVGFSEFTPEQIFWISAGNAWCSKYQKMNLESKVTSGRHPPGDIRMFGSFINNDDFASDFECESGSRMNPEKKCRVW